MLSMTDCGRVDSCFCSFYDAPESFDDESDLQLAKARPLEERDLLAVAQVYKPAHWHAEHYSSEVLSLPAPPQKTRLHTSTLLFL